MTLRQAAGQVLVVGLEGPQLSALESAWLRLLRPGGVILFRRNIETAAQTYELIRSAMQAADQPLLRCIDVEGGTVDRLRDLIAPMPSPFAVAATNKTALFEVARQPHRPGSAHAGVEHHLRAGARPANSRL